MLPIAQLTVFQDDCSNAAIGSKKGVFVVIVSIAMCLLQCRGALGTQVVITQHVYQMPK